MKAEIVDKACLVMALQRADSAVCNCLRHLAALDMRESEIFAELLRTEQAIDRFDF